MFTYINEQIKICFYILMKATLKRNNLMTVLLFSHSTCQMDNSRVQKAAGSKFVREEGYRPE